MDSLILKIFSNFNNSMILNVLLAEFIFSPQDYPLTKHLGHLIGQTYFWMLFYDHQVSVHEITKPRNAKID